ncbi:hypothetical protein HW511_09390 [Asaia siamensis]|uniref:Uncharacterized protein n=1 Tax=Asaia siamensis TaxID=110479 RepID=A0ABQ1LZI7_9PROT|nr:hypothetical protein [Asaia siamensis]GBR02693.1 hypothetical protein AA0323_0058 [Asaia siamensis NRIC 0323]GGC31176.1 hypothetical protein GCM10007207_15840 [Asaia siamensis]
MTWEYLPPDDALRPADTADIAEALIHALRFDGRRRVHDADELMAGVVAARLVAHLVRCGFVLMKRGAIAPHDTSNHRHPLATDEAS